MKLEGKKIWIISPEVWGTIKLSKHHYAEQLAALGNDIVYIQSRESNAIHDKINVAHSEGVRYRKLLPISIQKKKEKSIIRRIANDTGGMPDVVWWFETSRFRFPELFENSIQIIHMVDLNQCHNLENFENVSLGLGTTPYIIAALQQNGIDAHFLNHGTAITSPLQYTDSTSKELNVVYSGNLCIDLLDRELILSLCASFPMIEFTFVGPYGSKNDKFNNRPSRSSIRFVNKLESLPNTKLIGSKSGKEYQDVLRAADIFLIAYRLDQRKQVSNPHKTMEMLSFGKTIITFPLDVYSEQKELMVVCQDHQEYLLKFEDVQRNIALYNRKELQTKRWQFAQDHSYSKQLQKIELLLNES